jgi:hypothetical protein
LEKRGTYLSVELKEKKLFFQKDLPYYVNGGKDEQEGSDPDRSTMYGLGSCHRMRASSRYPH